MTNVKCLKLSCEKEAQSGFECCGSIHGADIRFYRSQLPEAFKATDKEFRGLYTVEEALTYLK